MHRACGASRENSMRHQSLLHLVVSIGAVALTACASPDPSPDPSPGASEESVATTQQALDVIGICNQDPRVWMNMVPLSVCAGARLFFDETFGGNGRSCGTCHPAANNFTIDAPFIASLHATQPLNPLFVAENPAFALAALEDSGLIHGQFALIKENVDDDFQDPLRFVGRAVNHTFSLATSIARDSDGTNQAVLERTGWGGDGAPGNGTLREFIDGAIKQHYPRSLQRQAGVDFRFATSTEKDQLVAFQMALGRTAEINFDNVSLTDAGAAAGRVAYMDPFQGRCNECHFNGGANIPQTGKNKNFDTGVTEAPTSSSQLAIGFMFDGGFGGKNSPVFTHTTVTGQPDAFGDGTFSTPPVIEAADTGPFFHTHAFGALGGPTPDPTAQIEQAVTFYATTLFGNSPSAIQMNANFGRRSIDITSGTQINDIGRFLRVLNVSFNLQLALQRLNASHTLNVAFWGFREDVQKGLISLAREETDDALRVLSTSLGGPLHPAQQTALSSAITLMNQALAATDPAVRRDRTASARTIITSANGALGTGMTFQLGAGNLMF
jgi:cytochrome c peroxidase